MKILITGGPGQDAYYLAYKLREKHEVTVLFRSNYLPAHWNEIIPNIKVCTGYDMLDKNLFTAKIDVTQYDAIYNMACKSSVGDSFNHPETYMTNNINSHINLLEAVRLGGRLDTRIYYPGSSEECPNTGLTKSPYGISKATIRNINRLYNELYKMHICHVFHYNHVSPYQSNKFLFGKVTKYVADLCNKRVTDKLEVGYLGDLRTYLHAEDAMNAAMKIMEVPYPATYTVSDNEFIAARHLVNTAFKIRGYNWEDHVVENKELKRIGPTMHDILFDDRTTRALGWSPSWTLEEILDEAIEHNAV